MARLTVKVHPRAKRSALAGQVGRGVEVGSGGAAGGRQGERGVRAVLRRSRGVPRSRVRIVTGATGRLKVVEVEGVEQEALERLLEK